MKNKFLYLIPFFLLVVGLYLMPLAIFEHDFSKMPGDLGDTRFNNYILEHGHKYFTGKTDSFWNAPFLYPYKNVTALSDNLLGTLPIYSIFRGSGVDREIAFLYWLISLFALNFIFCFIALNKWSENIILSSVGAYIYAFSIYNIGQLDHVQVFPRFIAPLVIYWCWKFISERKLKYFLLTSLGLVYQFYCGMYLAFMLSYILMFLCIAYFVVYRDRSFLQQFRSKKTLAYFISIIVLSFLLLLPLLQPYLEVAKSMGMRKFDAALTTIPKPRSYFFAPGASLLWSFLSHHCEGKFPDWWNHYLFFGALPWLGVIGAFYSIISKRISGVDQKFIYFLLLSVFLSVIFCLNLHGVTLYKIIFKLPGFSSMRSIDRFINMEVLLFVILFVFVFKKIYEAFPQAKYFIFSLPLLVVLDNCFNPGKVKRFEMQLSQKRIADVKKQIADQYDAKYTAIAYMPFQTHFGDGENGYLNMVANQLDAMTAAQELNIPCVNSYTGFDPGNYLDFFFEPSDKTLKNWCDFNQADYTKIQHVNDLKHREISRTKVNLQGYNRKYLTAIEGGEPLVFANREVAANWETFFLVKMENGECIIKAETNLLFSADVDHQGKLSASKNIAGDRETFQLSELKDSTFVFKAANGKFLSVDTLSLQVFAKSAEVGKNEKFRIIEK